LFVLGIGTWSAPEDGQLESKPVTRRAMRRAR
jgi:hypothetical protein